MRDPRPLSERFDLTYVRRRLWPYNWTRWLSISLAIAAGTYLAVASLMHDKRVYSAGEISHAHAMFTQRCDTCHQPDRTARTRYWLPAADTACLKCHDAGQHPDPHAALYAGQPLFRDRLAPVVMSSNCAACHTEHKGADHNLKTVADSFCVQCHGDLDAYAKGAPAKPQAAGEAVR
ncbi:MAG: hypothetical protein K8S99_16620 [Planctomycetes bacterium]|nr:hypothetical protein [Planctomycetota bacterium]